MRVEADSELARALQHRVRAWQKQRAKGKARPYGSCGTATATVLLGLILAHMENIPSLKNDMAVTVMLNLLDQKQPQLIAQEVAHCSASMNAKERRAILEIRLTGSPSLYPMFPWLRMCLCSMRAELLGSKPQPNWACREEDHFAD